MRWDSRHDQGTTWRGRGRWVDDAVPVQQTAVHADPLIQVCTAVQGELIHL